MELSTRYGGHPPGTEAMHQVQRPWTRYGGHPLVWGYPLAGGYPLIGGYPLAGGYPLGTEALH